VRQVNLSGSPGHPLVDNALDFLVKIVNYGFEFETPSSAT
jgi:hypothetical protein